MWQNITFIKYFLNITVSNQHIVSKTSILTQLISFQNSVFFCSVHNKQDTYDRSRGHELSVRWLHSMTLNPAAQHKTSRSPSWCMLNCPHNEMKLRRNSFKTVSKLFWNCFVSVSFRYVHSFILTQPAPRRCTDTRSHHQHHRHHFICSCDTKIDFHMTIHEQERQGVAELLQLPVHKK